MVIGAIKVKLVVVLKLKRKNISGNVKSHTRMVGHMASVLS